MADLQIKIGKLLKAERERQGLDLVQLSSDLKIPEQHLLAIESGDIGALPSALYFKLFARSYAEAIGLDYTKALDILRDEGEEDIGEGEDRPMPAASQRSLAQARSPRAKGGGVGIWLLVGAFVVILGVVAWLVFLKGSGVAGESDLSNTSQASESDTGASEYVPGTAASREESALDLDLMARDRTWAVVIADGDTALQTNLKPWREYYIGAQDSLIVSIGAPLAVDIMLNGVTANLSSPEDGSISAVVVTPENAIMYVQRGIDSLTDTTVNPDSAGTGSSSAIQPSTDTASTGRGIPDGT